MTTEPHAAQGTAPPSPTIVITVSRLLGAGGAILGQRLARRLGFAYLDREILQKAAQHAGCKEEDLVPYDERISRFWESLMASFAVGPPEHVYVSPPAVLGVRDQDLFNIESKAIQELVEKQNAVVIGRGAFHILRAHRGLIRLFLHSPVEARIRTVMDTLHLKTEVEARQLIEQIDRDRERFVREMTGRSITDARNFDLCFETSRVDLDTAEEMVATMVNRIQQRK